MHRPATQSKPAPTRAATTAGARPPVPVWLVAALLALVTIAVYWPVGHYQFTNYDDPRLIFNNQFVRGGLTLPGFGWALTTSSLEYWHPLMWLSHMLDCQLFGLWAGGHHLVSLGFHVANTLLLFAVLRRMTAAFWRSAMVAALFALHPLHIESVVWLAERKDLLSGFFFMLTLWAYSRYVEVQSLESDLTHHGPRTTDHRPQTTDHATRNTQHVSRFYLLSLVFFACGLMSKPMLVTLPFVLLLLDYWPLHRFQLNT